MSDSKIENITIIGSGAAGLTAAIYNARAELSPLVIEGEQPGGQLTITSDVENFPGFSKPVLGPDLMDNMRQQAENFGTRFIPANVVSVDLKSRPFSIVLSDDSIIQTKALIIATGAVAKWLNVPGEDNLKGKGVSACATCDGYYFKNRDIAVVGGGDTALEEATFLTRYAKSVLLIHRRDKLRGSAAMITKANKNPKIKFLWNSVVSSVHGDTAGNCEYLMVENVESKEVSKVEVQGLFVAIGHKPNSELFKDQLNLDDQGYITRVGNNTSTNIEGVFVAGDVSDHVYRQAITAAGMGCQAAIDAQQFLERDE